MRGAPEEAPPEYASPGAGEALERDHARAVAAAALLEPAAAAGAPRAPAASVHRAAAAGHSWLRRLPATPHAATTVEPALLACVRPPAVEYEPAIPRRLARAGALSDLQLEAVLAIGRTHSTLAYFDCAVGGLLRADACRLTAWLKGSIGEGSNHSNFSHQSSVKILSKFSTFC